MITDEAATTKMTPAELNVLSAYRAYVTARHQVMSTLRDFVHQLKFVDDKKRMRRILRQSAKTQGTEDLLGDIIKNV